MNSNRLPRKLALDLHGKTVLERTIEQAQKTRLFNQIVLATDSIDLAGIGRKKGIDVVMTPNDCVNGSERCSVALQNGVNGDGIVILQGDEPFVDPLLLDGLVELLMQGGTEMVSAMYPIDNWSQYEDPSVVKVVCNHRCEALYFSRSPIPNLSRAGIDDLKGKEVWAHIGVYGYQRSSLLKYPHLVSPFIEEVESLEQLRALSAGWRIKMLKWSAQFPGINTEYDLIAARSS